MELSEFTLRLLLLLLPGVISTSIFQTFTTKGKLDNRAFAIRIIILGFFSYLILYLLSIIFNGKINCTFFNALIDSSVAINYIELIIATIIGIAISIIYIYISNFNLLYKIGNKIKLSTRTGDIDVWADLFNNSNQGYNNFVYIIFVDKDILYGGSIQKFSVSSNVREIVLVNVVVYSNSNRDLKLREMDMAYLQIPYDQNVIIEIIENKENKKGDNLGNEREQK